MPHITIQDMKDLGLSTEALGQTDDTIDAFLQGILDVQSGVLMGRIGATVYNDTTSPTQDYAKQAELALCAVELYRRRIAVKLSQGVGAGELVSAFHENQAKLDWAAEAESWIARLPLGGDFASGATQSDHFDHRSFEFGRCSIFR